MIVTIIVKNRHQLEYEDLSQIDKQVDKEETEELQKIKKELKIVEDLRNVLKMSKKND